MSDKRDSKDKIVVLWSNPYDNQNGTDMYKSLSIDASVTSKTIKNILEGKSNFKIDTFQDIASSAGMRYFMLPFVQNFLQIFVKKCCNLFKKGLQYSYGH